MKGQHLVVNEVLLFAIGVLITAHVALSFSTIQASLNSVSTKDHFRNIGDVVAAGVVRTAAQNSSAVISLPDKISGKVYVVSLKDDSVIVYDFSDPETKVSQKLFNIAQTDCSIEGIFCLSGEVLSTAGRAEIYLDGKTIKIRRG